MSQRNSAGTDRATEKGITMASRPISPHLSIYRWYLTMALSIGHRVSGSALAVLIVGLTWWLLALATGPDAFATIHGLAGSILGRLVLFAYTLIVCYHMANGVRHLAWDMGYGFEPKIARSTGQMVLAAAGFLSVAVWLVVILG